MNNDISFEQDAVSREKTVNDIFSNFFVEAGAGSGKTTILVKRMVAMVEAGIDVSKICAITFTKAAAGEFYNRFQKMLIERSTAPTETDFTALPGELCNPTDKTRNRCLAALNNIDLCFMGTIDSFCNTVLSEHPAKAKIPSDSSVLSDGDMKAVYKKEYSKIQRGEYGEELKSLCKRFKSFYYNPDEVFLQSIGKLMDTRNCRHIFNIAPNISVDELLKDEKAVIIRTLRTLSEHPELKNIDNKKSESAWVTLETKDKLLFEAWENNISGIMKTLKDISDIRLLPETDESVFGVYGFELFQPHYTGNNIKWYELKDDGIPAVIKKLSDFRYSVTMEFLKRSADKISDTLRKEGKLTYFDYLLYLRDMLREDAENGGRLINHIYNRHSYFLIDEFQDTNPMQAEIFFYLTAQNPQSDWQKCMPQKGSLFIVGDPKQSIYRFRYADVSSFLKVKELFENGVGEVLYLTRNFRSTYKMCNWFNGVFSELLPESTEVQSRFEPIPLESESLSDGTFEGVYYYSSENHKNAEDEDKDPQKVVKIIKRLVGNPAYLIKERGDTEKRTVDYRDIMLITPRKTKLALYTKAFSEAEIPFRIEGKVTFGDCPSLITVSRIFSAVAYSGDTRYLFAALCDKYFGITLNQIHALKNSGFKFNIYADNQDIKNADKAVKIMKSLKSLVYRSRTLSAAALFTTILEEFKLFKYVSTDNLEYLYFALELVRANESAGGFASLCDAADYLEGLIGGDTDTERAISLTRNANRVHIANLHKVKGLEAPIVILADPIDIAKKPEIRVEHCTQSPECRIFEVKSSFTPLFSCSGFEEEKAAEQLCLDAEKDRLLYVAATRARRALIVADDIKANGESRENNAWKFFVDRAEGDFFSLFPEGEIPVTADKSTVSAEELYKKADEDSVFNATASYNESYEIKRPSHIMLKGKTASEDNFEDEESAKIRTETVRKNANIIGTLVHGLMEALVSSRNKADLSALANELTMEYEAGGEYFKELLIKVGTTLRQGGFEQQNGAPKDILKTLLSADEVHCEVPFCRKTEENGETVIWHGIMDAVYRQGDNWYIIDYKTNADSDGLDLKYEDQLSAYSEAFKEVTGNTATALIYHIEV